MKNERLLKISAASTVPERYTRKINFHPKINISGKWLKTAGFLIGESVRVIVADNYIQIVKNQTAELKKEVSHV